MIKFTALVPFFAFCFIANSKEFSPEEIKNIISYWSASGRYATATPVNLNQSGPWQIRLSVEGSIWLWKYNRMRGTVVAPTKIPRPQNQEQELWEDWINRKIEYDYCLVKLNSENANLYWLPKNEISLNGNSKILALKLHPGPIPEGLGILAGNPPCFARAVTPLTHIIQFHDNHKVEFIDNVERGPRFAYYRFPQGIIYKGPIMNNDEADQLFRKVGLADSERKVIKSVSKLEGTFESLNTYDTGYVSVGFVQFKTGENGKGSLCKLLKNYKMDYPEAYQNDFRRFGIDINTEDTIIVIDPSTGTELVGLDAVMKIIDDKRLVAVFQRSSSKSIPFKIAQIRTAKSLYYPAEKLLTISSKIKQMQVHVKDIFRSEAGMATILDRYLNTGKLAFVESKLSDFADQQNITNPLELANFEKELIKAITYREDFLLDGSLSQPR